MTAANDIAAPVNSLPMSSMCRTDEHDRCKMAQARCGCVCHGPAGQLPPKPGERVLPKPPAGTRWASPPAKRPAVRMAHVFRPEVLDMLRNHPGQWMMIYEYPSDSRAGAVAAEVNGKEQRLGPGWQAEGRRYMRPQRRSELYLRYVGEAK